MSRLNDFLNYAIQVGASDVHLTIGEYPAIRRDGEIERLYNEVIVSKEDMKAMVNEILTFCKVEDLNSEDDFDLCYVSNDNVRFRTNIYTKQGERAIVLRALNSEAPNFEDMNLPDIFRKLSEFKKGMVLITGPTGSGKSTTLAAMINHINDKFNYHVLTFEDPTEYVYENKCSIVSQREIGRDVPSFARALKSALREDPDVILVGEMRDIETIGMALTAAETGHFLLSTLHTNGAAKTIDRIIDVFPTNQQEQIRTQLAGTLRAIVSQVLLPKADGRGRIPAFEIMVVNEGVASCIKQNKLGQLNSLIQTGGKDGMISMDFYIRNLLDAGKVRFQDVKQYIKEPEMFKDYYRKQGIIEEIGEFNIL